MPPIPETELNLRDYWLILRKRRWIAIAAFLGVVIFTIIYTNAQVAIYRATASVRVTERKAASDLMTAFLTGTAIGDPMLSQTKVVQSRSVLELAARRLGWLHPTATVDEVIAQAGLLRGLLEVKVVTDTDVMELHVQHEEPMTAMEVANAIAEAYREHNLLEKNSQARALREFTEQQLQHVERRLGEIEEQLKTFQIAGEAKGEALAVANQLMELQAERLQLLQQFTELHPNVRRLDERITTLNRQGQQLPDVAIQFAQLTRERELAEQSYRTLKAKYDEARIAEAEKVSDVSVVNPATLPTAPIKPNKKLNYLLGLLVGGVLSAMSAFVVEHLDTSIGTIEDVEEYLQLPVLGVIPYLSSPQATGKEHPWLTELKQNWMPRKPHRRAISRLKEQILINYPTKSPQADAFRLLRTNVRMEAFNNDMNHKTMLITSAGPDEGKTVIACNLALAFAQEGRSVLLADADLRRPSVHLCFGFRKKEPGLTNVLMESVAPEQAVQSFVELMMGDVGFDAAIQTPGLDNLSIITAGSNVDSPPDLLESKALGRFLDWARARYDLTIVDAAPVLAVADPILIAPRLDVTVLIYKVGKTARRAIQRAKTQLEGLKIKLGGVVLNNISPEVEMSSTYYYRQYRYPYEKAHAEEVAQAAGTT